jgi:hypothetical protein
MKMCVLVKEESYGVLVTGNTPYGECFGVNWIKGRVPICCFWITCNVTSAINLSFHESRAPVMACPEGDKDDRMM